MFGSLFNNIVIQRRDGKILPVPIAYGPRSKWLEAQKGMEREEEMFEKLLPRMSYEMVAMNYDTVRKLNNKQKVLRTPDIPSAPRQRPHAPVPYNVDFSLYVETKNLNDGWQIAEQILPFFTPSYTVKVRNFPEDADSETPSPTNEFDMPITLNSITWADDWTGDIGNRRTVEWTFEFNTKIWIYGPVMNSTVILDSRAILAVSPEGKTVSNMSRADISSAMEAGYINMKLGATDSESAIVWDSDTNSSLSPNVKNLFDSDGNILKIIRSIDLV